MATDEAPRQTTPRATIAGAATGRLVVALSMLVIVEGGDACSRDISDQY